MKYLKNIKSSVYLNISKIVLQFVCSVLLSRSVGASGQGQVSYFFLIFDLLGTYGNFGITHATTYFYKVNNISKRKLSSVNTTYLMANGTLLSILVFIMFFCTAFFEGYSIWMIILGCIYFISVYFYNLFHEIIVGDENISGMNTMIFICTVIKTLVICIAYIISLLTVETYIITQVSINVLMMVLLGTKTKTHVSFALDFQLLIKEFRFGIIVYLSALFGYLNYRIDQFMIKQMMTQSDLGIYSIAVTISELAFFIPTCISAALSGRLYNSTLDEKKNTLSYTIKYSVLACLLVIIIGIMGAFLIPTIYGSDFADAILPTILLLIGSLFASIGKIIYPYYVSTGRPVTHMVVAVIISVVNLVCNLFMIPLFGIVGAAIASVASYAVYGSIYIFILKKKDKMSIKKTILITFEDIREIKKLLKLH